MRTLALVAGLILFACGGSSSSSSSTDAGPTDAGPTNDWALGFTGSYQGHDQQMITAPDGGSGITVYQPSRVQIGYLTPSSIVVAPDFGYTCRGSPTFVGVTLGPTTFRLESEFSCQAQWEECGGATTTFLSGSGTKNGDALTIQLDGLRSFSPDGGPWCSTGDWPYSYTFTGTRSGP